jgi:lipid-binding SYLF domain-containing protein
MPTGSLDEWRLSIWPTCPDRRKRSRPYSRRAENTVIDVLIGEAWVCDVAVLKAGGIVLTRGGVGCDRGGLATGSKNGGEFPPIGTAHAAPSVGGFIGVSSRQFVVLFMVIEVGKGSRLVK